MKKTYTVEEIRTALAPVFRSHGVKRAVVFGSYSRGEATPRSDVDIFVDSRLEGLAFFGLLEDVVETLKMEVDPIDRRMLKPGSDLIAEIERNRIEIFPF
jgi:predicted nucleotidyltransferase